MRSGSSPCGWDDSQVCSSSGSPAGTWSISASSSAEWNTCRARIEVTLASLADAPCASRARRRAHLLGAPLERRVVALDSLRPGFRYVDADAAPWLDLSTGWRRALRRDSRPEPGDVDRCAHRAGGVPDGPVSSRWAFDRASADGVYEKWVRSWHSEPHADRRSRARRDDGVAGFIMFEVIRPNGDEGEAVTSLVLGGVDPRDRRSRHGAPPVLRRHRRSRRGCQHSSRPVSRPPTRPSINLYAKLGFRLTSSGVVTLHRWSEARKGFVRILVTGGAGFIGSTS